MNVTIAIIAQLCEELEARISACSADAKRLDTRELVAEAYLCLDLLMRNDFITASRFVAYKAQLDALETRLVPRAAIVIKGAS